MKKINKSNQPKERRKHVCICGHSRQLHAIPRNHIMGTSHCTAWGDDNKPCMCGQYEQTEETIRKKRK